MKPSYRSILLLTATIGAVSLYAFLGPDPQEMNAEKQLEAVVATASINKQDTAVIDQITRLPVLKNGLNELVFTSDIQEAVASKLMEELLAAGFFDATSAHKLILGREPNNYIIFYTLNSTDGENKTSSILKKLLQQLSSGVFNHQPVVIKIINQEKEVLQVIM